MLSLAVTHQQSYSTLSQATTEMGDDSYLTKPLGLTQPGHPSVGRQIKTGDGYGHRYG